MKKLLIGIVSFAVASMVFAAPFTDVSTLRGKTDIKTMSSTLDANFAILEGTAGAKNGATVTATESVGALHKTTLTLADTPVIVDGTSGVGYGGTKIYDLPEGRIFVLGVTAENITITVDTNALDDADGGDVSLGTTAPDDGTVTGTDVDLGPSTSIDAITNVTDFALGAAAQFDGTATAKDVYLNMLIDDADISAIATNTVDGTIVIHYLNLGDY